MNNLSKLLCGDYENLGELSKILELLDSTIENFSSRCFEFLEQETPSDIATLGVYCGRSLLEASFTALIGRVMPYRLLLLREYQKQPNYDIGIRHTISIEWKGDILPKQPFLPTELWKKLDVNKSTNALLSDYMKHIYWKSAFEQLLDDTEDANFVILTNLRNSIIDSNDVNSDSFFENVFDSIRREADTLYSSLSKGIHQEFIIPLHMRYDTGTVQDLLQRTIELITKLALISHYIPTAVASIDTVKILQCLDEVEKRVYL